MENLYNLGEKFCELCEINPSIYACQNDKGTTYLGLCCADEHFLRTDCNHCLVELEYTNILEPEDHGEISKGKNALALRELNQALLNYLGTIQAYRDRVQNIKQAVESKIKKVVSSSLNTLELLESEINDKLELIDSNKKKTLKLVVKYEKHGLSGVMSEYYK